MCFWYPIRLYLFSILFSFSHWNVSPNQSVKVWFKHKKCNKNHLADAGRAPPRPAGDWEWIQPYPDALAEFRWVTETIYEGKLKWEMRQAKRKEEEREGSREGRLMDLGHLFFSAKILEFRYSQQFPCTERWARPSLFIYWCKNINGTLQTLTLLLRERS